ncbi:BA75_03274T0 [Komagataella pastoris]|uniref:BA75_03274T0 n=1 Tax=Komagataella pastoris TaxID=4922 RepID=A0A1B2JAL0_PICPA|nr:BA75_03274T0 [Komagataella pastoris]
MSSNRTYAELLEKQGERLQKRWRSIIDKYSKVDLDEQGDLIDLHTGEIVEDNGHLESVSSNRHNLWKAEKEDVLNEEDASTEDIEAMEQNSEQDIDEGSSSAESSDETSGESSNESLNESLEDNSNESPENWEDNPEEESSYGGVSKEFSSDDLKAVNNSKEELEDQRNKKTKIKKSRPNLKESLPVFKKSSLDPSSNDVRYDKHDNRLIADENSLSLQDNLILINKSTSTPFSSPLRKSPQMPLISPTTPTRRTLKQPSYFSTPRRTKPDIKNEFLAVSPKTASPTKRRRSSRTRALSSSTNAIYLDLTKETNLGSPWTDNSPTKNPTINTRTDPERDTAIDDEVLIDN